MKKIELNSFAFKVPDEIIAQIHDRKTGKDTILIDVKRYRRKLINYLSGKCKHGVNCPACYNEMISNLKG